VIVKQILKNTGERDCMKEGGGEDGECKRERALGLLLCHIP
jgi:hypothetical protein